MNWQNKKILVTGAGGFIGSHLTESLVELGAQVRAFVRYNSRNDKGYLDTLHSEVKKSLEIHVGDLKDPNAVRRAVRGRDCVFHLGALIAIPYSYINPMDFVQTNVVGTANVLNACLDSEVERLVHTSTSEVFGTMHYAPIDEKHPIEGKSPYAASKIGADHLVLSYHRSFGLRATVIRPFNTYGPRQSLRAIIPTIITQALNSDCIRLGSLHPTRDFNYVTDTIRGLQKAVTLERTIGETINLGTGRETSILQLCEIIRKLIGRDIPIIKEEIRVRPATSEVDRLVCDNSKARKMLEWQPRISLEEGLQKTIEWIEQNASQRKTIEYVI
ncbi:MAG: GDP-mannose 4,6-dehydratase [candidate division KSB1 bacterium]|nr:GDP-mannose 4,6-dehydratase [candidate division KSB1 bacterium]MDZ7301683.1 GDP-mannose 4,6-dehydratase [candidate division KSB1 bacterium]MDZ7312430.1 GDP-mannose 4,6-dehydratase [candidate division KSB1 bacterium]